jgi:hypothetical protein
MIYYPEMEFVANASPSLIVEGHDPFGVLLAARILYVSLLNTECKCNLDFLCLGIDHVSVVI